MRQYRIGLVGLSSTSDYPMALRCGVQNAVEEAGHTLVYIADLVPSLQRDHAESNLRVACNLAARLDLDVVIVPAGCLVAYLDGDNDKAVELTRILDPATTLVLERSIPGYRCIAKDNTPGMHDCMRHLIETCGLTRIAFVSGPGRSQGARERESVYFEEMAAHGLETPPSMFARGLFSGDCAEVVERLIDNNPDLQAIACACDRIAYTTYEVLNRRMIGIGTSVAVTGFDDHPRSAHMDPPLSTVHMTSYDFGNMAAREALRMCEGLPQEESVISSTFVARNSCGEDARGGIAMFRDLLCTRPFPAEEVLRTISDATLTMAGRQVTQDFDVRLRAFFEDVVASYRSHMAHPRDDDMLFSSQNLGALFRRDYESHLSLEGFHSVMVTLLEALVEVSDPEDAGWVVEQISFLHLHISRLMGRMMRQRMSRANQREWSTFHLVDDALRSTDGSAEAYERMCEGLSRLGVRDADLFLLPEPLEFANAKSFALSDTVYPLGGIRDGEVQAPCGSAPVGLQELLSHTLGLRGPKDTYAVSGIIAGSELLGVVAMDPGNLDMNGQFMVFMSLGIAFKHLQLMVAEHEMNQLLSNNNLQLQRQSQHDEMTGLLNRRGFHSRVDHVVHACKGKPAAVLYMDLDGLKGINDSLGHDVGDEAIRNTAQLLRDCLPDGSVLCRMGGDEFAAFVLLDEEGDASDVLQTVQDAMSDFNRTHDACYELWISTGMCAFRIDDATMGRLPDYMTQADTQLYDMKRARKAARTA